VGPGRPVPPRCPGAEFVLSNAVVRGYSASMRGDKVEVLVDVGNGVRGFEVVATRSGRRVEVTTSRNMVEVAEVTRTGQTVRSARFLVARVVAIVEHPAADGAAGGPPA
jgi:hypothetical protein